MLTPESAVGRETGAIKSPGFPKEYPLEKECIWVIKAPPDYKITLTFHEFHIEVTVHTRFYFSFLERGWAN